MIWQKLPRICIVLYSFYIVLYSSYIVLFFLSYFLYATFLYERWKNHDSKDTKLFGSVEKAILVIRFSHQGSANTTSIEQLDDVGWSWWNTNTQSFN